MKRHSLLLTIFGVVQLALPSPALADGGFTGFLRGVTGALGGTAAPAPQQNGVTPTLGVRGMDEEDAASAKTAPASNGELKRLETWAETAPGAEAAAAKRGLAARSVTYTEGTKP